MSGLLDGEVDCPLPKRAVIIMKYLSGLSVLSAPMSQKLSEMAMQGFSESTCCVEEML
jgi:hypothetical protein